MVEKRGGGREKEAKSKTDLQGHAPPAVSSNQAPLSAGPVRFELIHEVSTLKVQSPSLLPLSRD